MRRGGWLALAAVAGCGRCGAPADLGDAGPRPTETAPRSLEAPAPLPPARPWVLREVRGRPTVAAPAGCRLRAPEMQAEVGAQTGFVAEPRSLGALVVADASGDGALVVADASGDGALVVADASGDGALLAGAGAVWFDAAGAVAGQDAVPWRRAEAVPRLARAAGGAWLATVADQREAGAWRAGLWRRGAVELIGEGDRFEAADLACDAGRCALLTSRRGRVAMPGAEVLAGAGDAPLSTWQRAVIEPTDTDSDAHPLAIAGWAAADGGASGAVALPHVALFERGASVFFAVDGDAAREVARVPAPHGVLDVLAMPAMTAMVHGAPVDDDGCPAPNPGGPLARVRIAQAGGAQAEVDTPAPPLLGALRRLTRGALATWIAPLGCREPRRVVYAVLLDETAKPRGEVIPVGDATRYAVASEGDDVDLWLQRPERVTWVRLRCALDP